MRHFLNDKECSSFFFFYFLSGQLCLVFSSINPARHGGFASSGHRAGNRCIGGAASRLVSLTPKYQGLQGPLFGRTVITWKPCAHISTVPQPALGSRRTPRHKPTKHPCLCSSCPIRAKFDIEFTTIGFLQCLKIASDRFCKSQRLRVCWVSVPRQGYCHETLLPSRWCQSSSWNQKIVCSHSFLFCCKAHVNK